MNKLFENSEKSLNPADIHEITSFLTKIGITKDIEFAKNQLNILNYNNTWTENLCNILEFSENMTFNNQIRQKYKDIITSLKKVFKLDVTIEELYNQYKYFTNENISLNLFLNWIIILDSIISNFNTIFSFEKNKVFQNMIKKKIEIVDISAIDSKSNSKKNENSLHSFYKALEKQPIYMGKYINNNL